MEQREQLLTKLGQIYKAFKSSIQRITTSKKLKLVLVSGLIIQIIFCITSVGYFHPDQHFQIIEFSSYQLKEDNAATSVWELRSKIRPTFQVHVFSGFKLFCNSVSIENPFHQLLLLRLLLGVTFLVVLDMMAVYCCKEKSEETLLATLLLINFSWFLPYSRTLFSSEIVSALVFFPVLIFFYQRYISGNANRYNAIFTGFLFSISFFLRFQMAFAIVGFAVWIILLEKQFRLATYIIFGFAIGIALNVVLDYNFYNQLVFTPYLYFKVNILEGAAASFGKQGFSYYIAVLAVLTGAPLVSILLLFHYIKTSIQKFNHPLVLSTFLFVVGLFLVEHKEERFTFAILNVIPIVIALNTNGYNFLSSSGKWKKVIRPILLFSIVINSIVLTLFIFNAYSQTIRFDEILSKQFSSEKTTVCCYKRIPLETESHLPLTFYRKALKNIDFIVITDLHSLYSSESKPTWLCATFNDINKNFAELEILGYKPETYSSPMIWNINKFLVKKKMNSINDIWVLYKLIK